MNGTELDYQMLYGKINVEAETTMAKCNCTKCNACNCACSCDRCNCISQCTGCKQSSLAEELEWEVA